MVSDIVNFTTSSVDWPGSIVVAPTTGLGGQQPSMVSMVTLPNTSALSPMLVSL